MELVRVLFMYIVKLISPSRAPSQDLQYPLQVIVCVAIAAFLFISQYGTSRNASPGPRSALAGDGVASGLRLQRAGGEQASDSEGAPLFEDSDDTSSDGVSSFGPRGGGVKDKPAPADSHFAVTIARHGWDTQEGDLNHPAAPGVIIVHSSAPPPSPPESPPDSPPPAAPLTPPPPQSPQPPQPNPPPVQQAAPGSPPAAAPSRASGSSGGPLAASKAVGAGKHCSRGTCGKHGESFSPALFVPSIDHCCLHLFGVRTWRPWPPTQSFTRGVFVIGPMLLQGRVTRARASAPVCLATAETVAKQT